jgi:hypothetical protein
VRVFQSTYVGRHDFPKTLPDFLLRQWFTLDARDRRAIRKAFRSRQWIGAALQLCCIGMTGTTLRSLDYVPAAVLHHLGRQFRQPAPDIGGRVLFMLKLTVSLRQCKIHAPKLLMRQGDWRIAQQGIGTYP